MKAIFLVLLSGILLSACSGSKVNRDEAMSYYDTIVQISAAEVKCFDEFGHELKEDGLHARENSPKKLDSLSLLKLEAKYHQLVILLDNDLMKFASIREVDAEIGLKESVMKHTVLADTSLKQIIPDVLMLLKNGLETMTEEQYQKFEKFQKLSDTNKAQREEIDELSERFKEKYKLDEE